MTKAEVVQKLVNAVLDAINSSDEFNAACADMPSVGLQRFVRISVDVFDQPQSAPERSDYSGVGISEPTTPASDADFLRSLRIAPDLEAR